MSPSCYTTFNSADYHQLEVFNEWRVKYNKTYGDERNISQYFESWKKNRILVDYHNHMKVNDFSIELNEFSDVSWKDWDIQIAVVTIMVWSSPTLRFN